MGYEAYDVYFPEPLGTERSSFQRTLTFGANAGDVILCFIEHDASITEYNDPAPSSTNVSWSAVHQDGYLNGEGQNIDLWRGKVTSSFSANTEVVTVADAGWATDQVYYVGAFFIRFSPTAGKAFVTEPVNVSNQSNITPPLNGGTDAITLNLTTTGSNSFQIIGLVACGMTMNLTELSPGTDYTMAFEAVRQNNATNEQAFMCEYRTQASAGTIAVSFTETDDDTSYGAWLAGVALEEMSTGAYDPVKVNMHPYYKSLLST